MRAQPFTDSGAYAAILDDMRGQWKIEINSMIRESKPSNVWF